MRRSIVFAAALVLLAACATEPGPPPPPPSGHLALDWRAVARGPELGRLDGLSQAWSQGLREARAKGHAADVAALRDLADPAAAAPHVAPPAGEYRCRTIKLGSKSGGGLAYVAYDWFRCRIEAAPGGLRFAKVTGSQRPAGLLYPDSDRRMVLLGSFALGDEPAAAAYGARPERDLVGVLERLPRGGWRIALPWPYWESDLDLIELQPAS
jgi:hypothetical protein